ncbi:AsmA family protein [Colwelliaceae bacterium 6471]
MRVLGKWIVGILLLLVIAVFVGSQFISTHDIVVQLTSKVQDITGRRLAVGKEAELGLFPSLTLELPEIRFANVSGSKHDEMVTMDKLVVHIPWLSLLSKQLVIEKFVFVAPKFFLEQDTDGKGNWQFNQQVAPAGGSTSAEKPSLPVDFDLNFGQVEIIDGGVTYFDAATNNEHYLEQINLKVLLPSLQQSLILDGAMNYMSENIAINANINSLDTMMNEQRFDAIFNVSSEAITLEYTGNVAKGGEKISGKLTADGHSLRELLAWQKIKSTMSNEVLKAFKFSSDILYENNAVQLKDLTLTLDDLAIRGGSRLTFSTPMNIQADVDLGILNLTPYLASNENTAKTTPEITTSNDEQAPVVWDNTAIDLSALNNIDLDIKLKSTALFLNEIKLAHNSLNVNVKQGKAVIKLEEFNAYNGQGVGSININAKNKPYNVASEFTLTAIDAEPLFTDVVNFNKLLGKGNINWQLNSQGSSQAEFIANLNGTLNLAIEDGAIKGVNLGALARSAQNLMSGNFQGVDLDKNFMHSEKTDFAALSGQFDIKKGNAHTDNISLTNPFIRVKGAGDINLPDTKLALKLATKLVATSQGQTGDENVSGITIPIKVSGPFHQVKFTPDVSSEAKDKIKEKVKDKLKKLFG